MKKQLRFLLVCLLVAALSAAAWPLNAHGGAIWNDPWQPSAWFDAGGGFAYSASGDIELIAEEPAGIGSMQMALKRQMGAILQADNNNVIWITPAIVTWTSDTEYSIQRYGTVDISGQWWRISGFGGAAMGNILATPYQYYGTTETAMEGAVTFDSIAKNQVAGCLGPGSYVPPGGCMATPAVGAWCVVTAGTGATPGLYRVTSIVNAATFQVDRDIHAEDEDITDGMMVCGTSSPRGTIKAVEEAPTAGGTGYAVDDILTVVEEGSGVGGTVIVTAVADGAVTAVELLTGGTGYVAGAAHVTTGGNGTGCTVNITATYGSGEIGGNGIISFPGDDTYGPAIIGFSTSGKPFQLGGTVLAAAPTQATSADVYTPKQYVNSPVVSGTTGGLARLPAEATADITATESVSITLAIPSGSRLLGCQFRVDAALATGELWDAAYSGGSTTALCSAQAVAQNTKCNTMHAAEIATNVTNVTIAKNGGGSFTAQGTIRAICYYETFEAMGDAP